jgi:alpha-beta hydrolase superfamily lysophospholipase
MAAAVSLAANYLGSVAGANAVHVVGYSTGAPLALHHTLEVMNGAPGGVPASLVLISPAIAVSPAAAGASWLRFFSAIPGLEKLAWTQIVPEFDPFKYNSFAVNAGDQVHRLTRRVASEIEGRSESGPIAAFPRTLVFLSTVDATVTAAAVIDNLLEHLAADQHELVLFDINRSKVKSTLLVSDPGPLTTALMGNDSLPFYLTVVGNENAKSDRMVGRRKAPFSTLASSKPLGERWPPGTISLSHVALPFPSDDPLYGARPADSDDVLHLGDIAFQGERGLLLFPADWLLRLRHNPFYDYLEQRTLDWIEASRSSNSSARLQRPARKTGMPY